MGERAERDWADMRADNIDVNKQASSHEYTVGVRESRASKGQNAVIQPPCPIALFRAHVT